MNLAAAPSVTPAQAQEKMARHLEAIERSLAERSKAV